MVVNLLQPQIQNSNYPTMKKLYIHNYVFFVICFLLLFFSSRHTSFANENLPKETLPISRPKPVFKAPFKPLPFKTLLTNVELYEFNPKAYAFDKIVGLQPILVGKDWQTVTNDPIKFTFTPSKPTAMLGEEIELTLTAELLDISPRLLFTLEELRSYSIKVILPQDFIQTGGTYLNFANGTLDPANSKHTYTIKGRYLDKPALDDCFKVLRKLNDEVFVLKNTACINVIEVDVVSVTPETIKEVREVTTEIDVNKVKLLAYTQYLNGGIAFDFNYSPHILITKCFSAEDNPLLQYYLENGRSEVVEKGGSIEWRIIDQNNREILSNCTYDGEPSSISGGAFPLANINSFIITTKIYSAKNCTGTLLDTKTIAGIIDRISSCPVNLSISAKERALCPGASTTITASTNCPATSISWQKDDEPYGSNGATTSVSTSGTYKAVCNNPAVVSNTVTITVSNRPTVPNISTNRYSITPGEFATLTATNCQGTVVWHGPNNFTETGAEISIGKPGNYQALCSSYCNTIPDYSDLSAPIGISLLPLRLESDKYEKYSNETAQISAYGCTNGFISWKLNGGALPQSDNPLTAYTAGTYSAQCTSFNGPSSDWVSLYISEKSSNSPRITASKTKAYPSDNITLSASGCPSGWFYAWQIPVHDPVTNAVTVQRWVGSTQTVTGPETYKVQCVLNENEGPFESITISQLSINDIDIAITPNKTEVNQGETVIFTATGNCPNGAGIRWFINGMNYWTWVGETFQAAGPGTYSARCESGYQQSKTVYYTIKTPKPGSVSIIADKPRVKDNEVVTLRAVGCDGEVNWTLPNGTEVRGSALLFNFGPGVYKAKCIRFGFSSEPASITIAPRNWDEPAIIGSNTSIATNELSELSITGCPNDWVGWRIPVRDANGNITYQISSSKTQLIREPGIYYYHCAIGNYTEYVPLEIHPAASNALTIKPSKTSARPDEAVVLTAYGCPNGTVEWEVGTATASGVRITYNGPGVRKAKCVGDYTNNGDWAMIQIRAVGDLTPFLTATSPLGANISEACPTEPVTITASNCPNGWWYQTQFVKPGMLDYWLTHRQQVDDLGEGFFDVFGFAGGSVQTQGPNIYFARCISPDGSWMGDFRDKYVVINPAFPTDLRATNNGPAMVGDLSVRLAVTEVPNASYTWAGPNTFTSGLRNPEITALTAAKSGIYSVTLNRGAGQSWGCSVTATTEIKITGCEGFNLKIVNARTGIETDKLPIKEGKFAEYDDLALSVEQIDGSPLPLGVQLSWTRNNVTIPNTSGSFLVTNQSGVYTVTATPAGATTGCKYYAILQEDEIFDERWDKARPKNFVTGGSVMVVPLEPKEYTLSTIPTTERAKQPRFKLLSYTLNNIQQRTIMVIFPYEDYLTANNYQINGNNFSGSVMYFDEQTKAYYGGWRYKNGIPVRRIRVSMAKNVAGDCYYNVFDKKGDCGCLFGRISEYNPETNPRFEDEKYLYSIPYNCEDGIPNKELPNETPPPVITPAGPNLGPWGSVTWNEQTGGPNSSTSHTNPPLLPNAISDESYEVLNTAQKIEQGIAEIISEASRLKGNQTPLTLSEIDALVNMLIKSIQTALPVTVASPSVPQSTQIQSNILSSKPFGAASTILSLFNVIPTLNADEAQNKILKEKESILNTLKSIILINSTFGQEAGSVLVNKLETVATSNNKTLSDLIIYFNGKIFTEETDILKIWDGLTIGLAVTEETPGVKKALGNDDTEILFSYNEELDEISLIYKNGNTIKINTFSSLNSSLISKILWEGLKKTIPELLPYASIPLDIAEAYKDMAVGNYVGAAINIFSVITEAFPTTKALKITAKIAEVAPIVYKSYLALERIVDRSSDVFNAIEVVCKKYTGSIFETIQWVNNKEGAKISAIKPQDFWNDLLKHFGNPAVTKNNPIFPLEETIDMGDFKVKYYPVSNTTGGPTITFKIGSYEYKIRFN